MANLSDIVTSAFWRVNPPDADPAETREWLDAFDALVQSEGRERATYLLRRLLDGGEAGEWLLDPIIEDTEIFATKAFDEMTAMIGDNHSHVDAVNADSNGWLLRVFLSLNKGTHARHGRQEQCRRHEARKVHRSAIQPTGPNGCPSNPSTRHSQNSADAARRRGDCTALASQGPRTAQRFEKSSWFLRPGSSTPLQSNGPSVPANRLSESRNS